MITVLLSFLYIGFITYIYGSFFMKRFGKSESVMEGLVAGIVIMTVYAQLFSLVYKVGLLANLILLFGACAILISMRKTVLKPFQNNRGNRSLFVLFAVITAIVLFVTAYGELHYDTGLYHAQSVRWIEDYGTAFGIGNLQKRLGYNSSAFALTALFSMKWLVGRSLHTTTGFIVVICVCYACYTLYVFPKKKNYISGALALATIVYWIYTLNGAAIPTSDYPSMFLSLWIVTKWAKLLENHDMDVDKYSLLSVCAVFTMTIKLSASMLVLMALIPAVMLIRNKEWKKIICYVTMGVIVLLPFLIRNVVISGWLLYPFAALDLFSVDWKVPVETAVTDAAEIKTWAWGTCDPETVHMSIREWFPIWWKSNGYCEWILLISNALAAVFWIGNVVITGIIRKKVELLTCFFEAVLCMTVLFWFAQAPLVRYGFAYLVMFPFAVTAVELKRAWNIRWYRIAAFLAAGAMLVLIGRYTVFYTKQSVQEFSRLFTGTEYLVEQRDYDVYPVEYGKVGSFDLAYPTETDQTGYYGFPGAANKKRLEKIGLRGDSIRSGFRMGE